MQRRTAFTLIELLTVIAIIAVLAAIIFPVFHQARRQSYKSGCLSNLRQIGMAFAMYAQDYDGKFAYGGDPTDTNSNAWEGDPNQWEVNKLRPLPWILDSYVKSRELWRCPADTGFHLTGPGDAFPLDASPSSFTKFGMSYYYRTSFALGQHPFTSLIMYDSAPPHEEHGVAEIGYLYDGTGKWHGGNNREDYRYNALHLDGHVKNIDLANFERQWAMTPSHP